MKLKTVLLSVCLLLPLLADAGDKQICLNDKGNYEDRDLYQVIPVEAYWDDETQQLSLEFWADGSAISIEVVDEMGNSVYYGSSAVYAGGSFQIPLTGLQEGTYVLFVSDGKTELEGEFNYEP